MIILLLFRFIADSAVEHQLSSFIPCHGGLHCITLALPLSSNDSHSVAVDLSNTSVVAGHFFWDVW